MIIPNTDRETEKIPAVTAPVATIRLIDGNAEIEFGDGSLTVSRQDAAHPICPVELIIGALGS